MPTGGGSPSAPQAEITNYDPHTSPSSTRPLCDLHRARHRQRDEAEILPWNLPAVLTTKENGRALGLRIATVYGIVKRCKGHVDMEVGPGRGAKSAGLSAPRPAKWPSLAGSAPPSRSAPGTIILLVEDEEPVRRLARAALEEQGCCTYWRPATGRKPPDSPHPDSTSLGQPGDHRHDDAGDEWAAKLANRQLAVERPGLPDPLSCQAPPKQAVTLPALGPPTRSLQQPVHAGDVGGPGRGDDRVGRSGGQAVRRYPAATPPRPGGTADSEESYLIPSESRGALYPILDDRSSRFLASVGMRSFGPPDCLTA